jgi:pterin-4a-carbinolamine dehydratase
MSVDPTGGSPIGNLIFLSYRRADTAPQTLALKLELERNLSAVQVFMDNGAIVVGAKFPDEIYNALGAATLVIAMIGKEWLGASKDGGRRIDDPEDWVFREISFALRNKTRAILPVFVDDTQKIPTNDLPEELKSLSELHSSWVSVSKWEASIDQLLRYLERQFRFVPKAKSYEFPESYLHTKTKSKAHVYSWEELQTILESDCPMWNLEFVDAPDRVFYKWINLRRDFKFNSYEQAIKFTNLITQRSMQEHHHPEFRVTWKTVTVWTSTWARDHRITLHDILFAEYLEREYERKFQLK